MRLSKCSLRDIYDEILTVRFGSLAALKDNISPTSAFGRQADVQITRDSLNRQAANGQTLTAASQIRRRPQPA